MRYSSSIGGRSRYRANGPEKEGGGEAKEEVRERDRVRDVSWWLPKSRGERGLTVVIVASTEEVTKGMGRGKAA